MQLKLSTLLVAIAIACGLLALMRNYPGLAMLLALIVTHVVILRMLAKVASAP